MQNDPIELPPPPSIFDRLIIEIERLRPLSSISQIEFAAFSDLVLQGVKSHNFQRSQLIKALETVHV